MISKSDLKSSRFMSLVLRHKPQEANLNLDEYGYANVSELLKGMRDRGYTITIQDIERIVTEDDKQRYSFNDNGTKIKANLELDLILEKYWGIDKDDIKNTSMLLLNYTNNDIELCKKIIKKDLYFNRYESCDSYLELAETIAYDDALWDNATIEDVKDSLLKLVTQKNEKDAQIILEKDGWICKYGLAIGFDVEKINKEKENQNE